MNKDSKSAAGQWGIPQDTPEQDNVQQDAGDTAENTNATSGSFSNTMDKTSSSGAMKRRGFFEAISLVECPRQRLAVLLNEFKQEAEERIKRLDDQAAVRMTNLNNLIDQSLKKIEELKEKLLLAQKYKEADDEELAALIDKKKKEEEELLALQNKLTAVRIKLGYAKSGIIDQSLEQAETQVRKALNIQKEIYDETLAMNRKRYADNKDHLAKLATYYQQLYDRYEARYNGVKKHLDVLDADGFRPATTQVLTSIGSVSFAIAGFFFSTFAATTNFGNQDVISFILTGMVNTANQPGSTFLKVGFLLGLIVLITLVSMGCNFLLEYLKRRNERIATDAFFRSEMAEKNDQANFQADIKSNNWVAFWLQLVPGILIAGLILLGVSATATKDTIGSINASSEGLIVGTGIAMTLAGLFYLYIIKIVEPRLLKRYEVKPGEKVNWIKANWELAAIVIIFLVFGLCIIFIPYDLTGGHLIAADQSTRYAILLFTGICLAGGIIFAYGVRNQGLITSSRQLEAVEHELKMRIANCSGPQVPEVYNNISEEHGNILDKVLKQLSYKASLYRQEPARTKRKEQPGKRWSWARFIKGLVAARRQDEIPASEPIDLITIMEPWEQRYFPHIVEELKAVEFEYKEKSSKVKDAEEAISDYRLAKTTERRSLETDILSAEKNIKEQRENIEMTMKESSEDRHDIRREYRVLLSDFLDGFHLGIWYRENGMGPTPVYFESCTPTSPLKPTLLSSAENINTVYE